MKTEKRESLMTAYHRLGKLAPLALYALLRDERPLLALSARALAARLSLAPQTVRWYLDDLASCDLVALRS